MSRKKIHKGGHRGLGCTDSAFWTNLKTPGDIVENSLLSIQSAFKQGADYVECDAVITKDEEVLILHSVNPTDHFFKTIPTDYINRLRFSDFKNSQTGRSAKGIILTLEELLQNMPTLDPQTLPWSLNIEIKGVQGTNQNYEDQRLTKRIAEITTASGYPTERILFSSFALENLLQMAKLLPNSKYGLLFSEEDALKAIYADYQKDFKYQYLPFKAESLSKALQIWKEELKFPNLSYAHPEITSINDETLNFCLSNGLSINTWALNEILDEERLSLYRKIDSFCTNQNLHISYITDYLDKLKI